MHSNKNCKIDHATRNDVIQNPNVLFLTPATEEEVLQISKELKMKSSAGYDEIPDMTIKQCIHIVKKTFDFYNKFIIQFWYLSESNENCKSTTKF
jgi:hypothetical protein